MVTTGKENVQAVLQGECTECGSSNDNYRVTNSEHKGSNLLYEVECDCGTEATVRITPDGLSSDDTVSYQNASWNRVGGSESSDENEEHDDEDGEEEEGGLQRDSDKQA